MWNKVHIKCNCCESIKTNLPSSDGYYLVMMPKNGKEPRIRPFYFGDFQGGGAPVTKHVTHWANLPEPPEVD